VTVLRFFFKVTLDRPETTRHLVFVYEPRKLPRVLSPEEVLRLLEAAPRPKHKAAFSVAYGAGLRAMEVVALKVSDIDSKRMMLRVEQGKGRKDRFAMLSPQLLELLRDWWRMARPAVWMFPGRDRISCAVEAIARFKGVLADCSKSREDRIEALKFVVHFVGDIHQPLHATNRTDSYTGKDDQGGNLVNVTFFGADTNLHAVWDTGLIMHTVYDWGAYVVRLEEHWLRAAISLI
jgi:S1/P1 Nuclease/Phage integrase family